MHVKGMELLGYEPRSLKTMALGLARAAAAPATIAEAPTKFSRDVDRLTADAGRRARAAASENYAAVLDSLIMGKFVQRRFIHFNPRGARLLTLVTGCDVDRDELRHVGARITNLKKLYNEREGRMRADDTLPSRILVDPLPDGQAAGVGLTQTDLDTMIDAYYWGAAGQSTAA